MVWKWNIVKLHDGECFKMGGSGGCTWKLSLWLYFYLFFTVQYVAKNNVCQTLKPLTHVYDFGMWKWNTKGVKMTVTFKVAMLVCHQINLETTPSETEHYTWFSSGKILGSHFVRKLFTAVFIADMCPFLDICPTPLRQITKKQQLC